MDMIRSSMTLPSDPFGTKQTDYIAARMGYRARLVTPSLWASQQTIEKYLEEVHLFSSTASPQHT